MFDVLLHDIVVLSKEVQLELTYADLIPKESHDSSLPPFAQLAMLTTISTCH